MTRDLFSAAHRAPPGSRLRQERVGPITVAELEQAQETVARLIVAYGEAAMPLFERLDAEIASRRSKNSAIDRVRALAAGRRADAA